MSAARNQDPDWQPEPLESGLLGPPGRKPPTAVGTATPRPPRRPHRPDRYSRSTKMLRIARGALGLILLATGVTLIGGAPFGIAPLGVALGFGVPSGALGGLLTFRAHRSQP
jgi:hypothetical protein